MTATISASAVVEQPGVYDGIPDEEYQRDPVPGGSLSHSGARMLLPPNCPALYHHWAATGSRRTREFDLGHAAHTLVLGTGARLVVVEADNWLTKAAKQQRDEARADGAVPILRGEYDQAKAIAAAVLQHPIASALFNPDRGKPEQSLFWVDEETGVWRRARLDWLPDAGRGRLIVPDLKTTLSAEPSHLAKALANYGYYQQAAWYLDGVGALELGPDPAFVFVFVEKTPPYLVTVAEADADALHWGRVRNRKALDLYRRCKQTGHWPGYSDDVIPLSLPGWAAYAHEAAEQRGEYEVESR
jgi:TPR repeat protein